MEKLEHKLSQEIKKAFVELFGNELDEAQIQLQKTRKEFIGDLTLVTFPFLKITRKSPEESAKLIGEFLEKNCDIVNSFNVVKGFLNIEATPSYWIDFLNSTHQTDRFGFAEPNSKERVMVEYSSPNTNKPLHLGHLRNNFLGNSVARILKANGHEVIKVQIINDRGIHICKSMLAWQKFGENTTPESEELKGDKFVGNYYVRFDKEYKKEIASLIESGVEEEEAKKKAPILLEAQEMLRKWEAGDEEITSLWKTMNNWVYSGFESTYQTMGVDFDKLYYESDTYLIGKDKVLKHIETESFYKKEDGSIWINLEADKLDNKLLLRSDGTSVYMTQDIGTAIIREEEFHCKNYYYVVGNEQDYHFNVLALVLQKMGFDWANGIEHLSYGMVDLPSGKMKSREGTVVDADDLMLEMRNTAQEISEDLGKLEGMDAADKDGLFWKIGLGALKYFILKVDPKKRMMFDPKESVDFNGNTGPFIQYTYARIQSILRKSDSDLKEVKLDIKLLDKEDINVIKQLYNFPEAINDSALQKSPALIANYVYELVKIFNHFYQNTPPIVKEKDDNIKNMRLFICNKTSEVIANSMSLLGISVPERM
ncbi:MAG: arginine--tRNA ligase [Flavobacteriales bacterium]|nr:arginine--tRNA ligase [Flavobacteriales bacterium]